jgi:SAM-dependent methyltransferase
VTHSERERWDKRYAAGAYATRHHPTQLVVDWLHIAPPGRALDVACGAGRNAVYLAKQGFQTDAVDISSVALERARNTATQAALDIHWIQADLAADPLAGYSQYAAIIHVRYVNMALYRRYLDILAPGGILISEQHLQCADSSVIGPKNPSFRVTSDVLQESVGALEIIFYQEGIVEDPDGRHSALAQIVARKPQ